MGVGIDKFQSGDSFLGSLTNIEDVGTGFDRTGIDTEEAECTKLVSCKLESQSDEGSLRIRA